MNDMDDSEMQFMPHPNEPELRERAGIYRTLMLRVSSRHQLKKHALTRHSRH